MEDPGEVCQIEKVWPALAVTSDLSVWQEQLRMHSELIWKELWAHAALVSSIHRVK